MTAGQYEKISAPFRDEKRGKALKFTNKLITAVGYASYPAMLIYIFFTMPHKLIGAVIVPASGFVLLTFVRRKINRPRPYEALDIKPLIYKDT
ncbi:MAG: phosphatase PAP2 family protein, partial [Clostridia bacterium]|nr:phosphatase PAP2 family protein [Clostridia bacterium]